MNHIKVTYGIEGGKSSNSHLRTALKVLLDESVILLAKGTGYSNGYYKIASKGKNKIRNHHLKVQLMLTIKSLLINHVHSQNLHHKVKLMVKDVVVPVQKCNQNLRIKVNLLAVNQQ